MATTENNYTGDGTTTSYSFSFPYIKKEDVRVTLNTIGTTDFTINDNTPTQVDFTIAPDNDDAIRIYRVTDTSTTASTFFVGSSIRAQDLNTNFEQALYIGQEEENKIQDVVSGGIADGSIDTSKINDNAVTAAKLGPNSVTTAKIVDSNVTTAKIADSNVTTAKIAPLAITQTKLAANSVRTAKILDGNVTAPKIESPLSGDLTFASSQTFPKIPANTQTAAYNLDPSDAGKHINITTGGVTVPSNIFSVGDVISIYNNSGSNQTITQATNVTLRQAGTANTGDRTLAQYGLATILCVDATTDDNFFVITGSGLT
jgi:hypothetical protein